MATSQQVEVDGRELKLTNLDKVLYPKAGFSKGEVVDYYAKVAPAMVPHLAGRAVTLRRFPEGVDDTDAAFFEKRCPKHRPEWVKTTPVSASTGTIDFCVCEDLPTLVWMAQLAAIELHPSLSLAPEHDRPTVLAFDLDPGPPAEVLSCCRGGAAPARALRPLRPRVLRQRPRARRACRSTRRSTTTRSPTRETTTTAGGPNRWPERSPSCSRSRRPTWSSRK